MRGGGEGEKEKMSRRRRREENEVVRRRGDRKRRRGEGKGRKGRNRDQRSAEHEIECIAQKLEADGELAERKRELARVKDAMLLDGKRPVESLLKDAKKFEAGVLLRRRASRALAKEREEAISAEKAFERHTRMHNVISNDSVSFTMNHVEQQLAFIREINEQLQEFRSRNMQLEVWASAQQLSDVENERNKLNEKHLTLMKEHQSRANRTKDVERREAEMSRKSANDLNRDMVSSNADEVRVLYDELLLEKNRVVEQVYSVSRSATTELDRQLEDSLLREQALNDNFDRRIKVEEENRALQHVCNKLQNEIDAANKKIAVMHGEAHECFTYIPAGTENNTRKRNLESGEANKRP
eukprot:758317-Hanusia_phi.AAC.1